MKIGIFGGAFDPVHNGHIMLAESCVEDMGLDSLIVVPTANPPHRDGLPVVSGEKRIKMLSLAFAEFKNVYISDIEFHRNKKSFTYDTIMELEGQNYIKLSPAGDELFLIIGADEFMNFHKWYRYKDILDLVTLYTVARCGLNKNEMCSYAKNVLRSDKYYISDREEIRVSSSEIRKKIKNKEDFSQLLNGKVYNFIETEGLYGV